MEGRIGCACQRMCPMSQRRGRMQPYMLSRRNERMVDRVEAGVCVIDRDDGPRGWGLRTKHRRTAFHAKSEAGRSCPRSRAGRGGHDVPKLVQ